MSADDVLMGRMVVIRRLRIGYFASFLVMVNDLGTWCLMCCADNLMLRPGCDNQAIPANRRATEITKKTLGTFVLKSMQFPMAQLALIKLDHTRWLGDILYTHFRFGESLWVLVNRYDLSFNCPDLC